MKKKILIVIVITVLLTFLTACGGGDKDAKTQGKDTSSTKPAASQKTSLTRGNVHEWYDLVTVGTNYSDVEKAVPAKPTMEPQGGGNEVAVYFNEKTGIYLEVWYRKASGEVFMKDIDLFRTDLSPLFKKTYTREHEDQINEAARGKNFTYDDIKGLLGEEGVEVSRINSQYSYVWCNPDKSYLKASFDSDTNYFKGNAMFIKR